ncbi:MAG: ATP-binding cassette domain-containing protein, partial [Planctomycetota bacterium]
MNAVTADHTHSALTESKGEHSVIRAIDADQAFDASVYGIPDADDCILGIDRFSLWYGESRALYDIAMNVPKGRVTALIGPSGCGKSTLLRSVNRLNDLVAGVRTEGGMFLNQRSLYDPSVDVIALRKRVGMVFQKSNPF